MFLGWQSGCFSCFFDWYRVYKEYIWIRFYLQKKIMKKFIIATWWLFVALFVVFNFNIGFAQDVALDVELSAESVDQNNFLTVEEFMIRFYNHVGQNIPDSYQYIDLHFKNIYPGTRVYRALQKGVYLWYLPNDEITLPLNKLLTQKMAIMIISEATDENIPYESSEYVTQEWLWEILDYVRRSQRYDAASQELEFTIQEKIMQDVYKTLTTKHIDAENLDKAAMEYGAIKWLAEATDDKYTSFFPPQDAKSFSDQMHWEYYGIGAHVEMPEPGLFIIISPISWSPAEKAGLQWGDIVTYVDDKEITQNVDTNTVISWIKWPKDTEVVLTIKRWEMIKKITVIRDKIEIDVVNTGSNMKEGMCYVKLTMFSSNSSSEFIQALWEWEDKNCFRYVIDLRNNPGGSLQEVVKMLHYFVPTGNTSVVIKSKGDVEEYKARKKDFKLTDKEIIILINKWSASASEIFAGTVKEYAPNSLLMWEKTYGKGSVQEILKYVDGSMLKYTVAKWYTGKSRISIDWVGLKPDVEILDNETTDIDEPFELSKLWNFSESD